MSREVETSASALVQRLDRKFLSFELSAFIVYSRRSAAKLCTFGMLCSSAFLGAWCQEGMVSRLRPVAGAGVAGSPCTGRRR